MIEFAWDEWNTDHIARHRVTRVEAEYVVRHARTPFPREIGDDKHLVWGRTRGGRPLQVVFVYKTDTELDPASLDLESLARLADEDVAVRVYVIHAMQLTPKMLRQYRKVTGE
jgi:hypothetical protein